MLTEDENGDEIKVEVLTDEDQLNILTDEATQQVLESNLLTSPGGTLQIEMSPHSSPSTTVAQQSQDGGTTSSGSGTASNGAGLEDLAAAVLSVVAEAEAEKIGKGSAAAKRKQRLKSGGGGGHPQSLTKRPKFYQPSIANAGPVDETKVELSFVDWLSGVTERVNQTMHFQFSGCPEPLVFHAPHTFFDCLWERMSNCGSGGGGSRRKRLPSATTIFERREAPPKGVFTKYTWNITNLLHVKQVIN